MDEGNFDWDQAFAGLGEDWEVIICRPRDGRRPPIAPGH